MSQSSRFLIRHIAVLARPSLMSKLGLNAAGVLTRCKYRAPYVVASYWSSAFPACGGPIKDSEYIHIYPRLGLTSQKEGRVPMFCKGFYTVTIQNPVLFGQRVYDS